MFDDCFEIIASDPMEPKFVEKALNGCYGVHISLPTEVEQQVAETVARMAAKHGVERITYVSGATVAEENRWYPLINRKFLAEQAIREAGVPYTIFCPTWFMESLTWFVVKGRASVLGKQPFPYHWLAAEDHAQMVSTAYGPDAPANKRVIIHGPEAIVMHEALRRYCDALHPDIKQVSTTPFWLIKALATLTNNRSLKFASELMAYFEKVGEGSHPVPDNLLGTPTMNLDLWLQKRKARGEGN